MIYVIATQLSDEGRGLEAVDEWIRGNFESWTHPVANLWVVEGPFVADQIHTALAPLLAPADRLVIVKAGTEAMWHGVSADAARWFADLFPGSLSERIAGKTEGITP
jgi:hypothetical protein